MSGFPVPLRGGDNILLTAQAKVVHVSQVRLCAAVTCVRAFLEPEQGLRIVLMDALAFEIQNAEVVIRPREVLVGCRDRPSECG